MYLTKKRGTRQPLCDLSQLQTLAPETPLYVVTKSFSTKVKPSAYSFLRHAAREVNDVWNYSNAICREGYRNKISKEIGEYFGRRLWVDEFTLNELTGGVTSRKIPNEGFSYITQSTVASTNRQLCHSRHQFNKYWLKFRKSLGAKKSLGWVPFKDEALLIKNVKFTEKSILNSKYDKKYDTRLVYNNKVIGLFEMDQYLELVKLSKILVPTEKEVTEDDKQKNEQRFLRLQKKALKENLTKEQLHEKEEKLRQKIEKDHEPKDIPMVRLLAGSFSEDSLGDWYFNQTVEILCYDVKESFDESSQGKREKPSKENSIGIDPNCKSIALSDGTFFDFSYLNKNFTTHDGKDITAYQKLALLQQNGHLRQAKRLHRKVARKRIDAMHKASTELLEKTDNVFFGDLNIKTLMAKQGKKHKDKIKKTRHEKMIEKEDKELKEKELKQKELLDKNVLRENKGQNKQKNKDKKEQERKRKKLSFGKSLGDQGASTFRQQISYKSGHMGKGFSIVDERGTTRVCSSCGQNTGPSGLRELVIREWTCGACGTTHHRDTNSGLNMLHAPVSSKYKTLQPGQRLLLGTIQNDLGSFAQG